MEYSEQLDRIESIKLAHQEFHKTAWELDKRNREIAILQDKLSDSHNALFQERTHLFRVIAENDGLKGKRREGVGGNFYRSSHHVHFLYFPPSHINHCSSRTQGSQKNSLLANLYGSSRIGDNLST